MSHQDRKSKEQIVVNHESLRQAVDVVCAGRAFRGASRKVRKGSKWTLRMLATVALFWAWSKADGLKERFQEARKVAATILRWMRDPGETYHGFVKQLRKWHVELQIRCISELRLQMKQDLFGQWTIAGYVVIAGDGSRIELPRTQSNEATYSPKRKKEKKKGSAKKAQGRKKGSRGKRWRKTPRQSAESIRKKANSPQMWLTLFWHVGVIVHTQE